MTDGWIHLMRWNLARKFTGFTSGHFYALETIPSIPKQKEIYHPGVTEHLKS